MPLHKDMFLRVPSWYWDVGVDCFTFSFNYVNHKYAVKIRISQTNHFQDGSTIKPLGAFSNVLSPQDLLTLLICLTLGVSQSMITVPFGPAC